MGGFATVDEYITDVLVHELAENADNFDQIFTAEVIENLQAISSEIKAGGKPYTMPEVEKHFEDMRKAWLAEHQA